LAAHDARAKVVHLGDSLDRVMEAVAATTAVTENLVVLHPVDDVFHSGADNAVLGVVVLFAREQGSSRAFCGAAMPQLRQAPSPSTLTPRQWRPSPDVRQA
jgi:hypothetical protein